MRFQGALRGVTVPGQVLACAGALFSLAGCGDLELPEPPDMSALTHDYDEPDGEITAETAAELGVSMADTVTETQASSPIELMGEMVSDLQATSEAEPDSDDEPSDSDSDSDSLLGERLDVAAIVRLHHKCRGWEGETPEAGNGTLDITATLDSDGLIPTIWGATQHCRYERHGYQVELDGDVQIAIGDNQPRVLLRELTEVPYLVEFEGHAVVVRDGERSDVDLHTHFRVMPDEKIQLLIRLPDGTAVVGEFGLSSLSGSETVISGGLRTRDTSWTCTLNLSNASGTCTDANDPTSTIEW